MWPTTLAVLLGSYLLGSLPSAYLVTRWWTGRDIRVAGNGNMGARNTIAVAGLVPGLITMCLDVGKGMAACWAVQRWGPAQHNTFLAGFGVVAGHCFPVWLGWRGGVGQAAASGYLAAMWPQAAAVGLLAFLLARLILPWHDAAYGLAAATFFALVIAGGASLERAAFIVLLLLSTAAKQAIDAPRQHALLKQNAGSEKQRGSHAT